MGTDLASTLSERWDALQQLEAAFNQADGNMSFTFGGAEYRSVGVNDNGTLRVIDQMTGQISTLDPVDVYSAARMASGNPVQMPVDPNVSLGYSGPSNFGKTMNQIGVYSGLANTAMQIKSVGAYLNKFPLLTPVLGSVTGFLSAYSAFSGIQGMFKYGVSKSGLMGVGMSALGIATGVNMAFLGTLHVASWVTGSMGGLGSSFLNPAGWAIAAAVIAGSVVYGSINDMVTNGVSVKGIATTATATLATALSVNLAIAAIHATITAAAAIAEGAIAGAGVSSSSLLTMALFTGPWGWIAAGALVLFSVLWALFHQPSPEEKAALNLTQSLSPVIWTPGPLAVVAVGTVAILMGWTSSQPPPAMASLTVPAYTVNQVLAAQGMGSVDLKSTTPTVLVEPGTGNVVIVSPNGTDSKGNPLVKLQSYALAKNLQFVSSPQAPPEGSYIPFFRMVNGQLDTHPSPDVTAALNLQDKMLTAVLSNTMYTHDALNALNVAAASNKYGVTPDY